MLRTVSGVIYYIYEHKALVFTLPIGLVQINNN